MADDKKVQVAPVTPDFHFVVVHPFDSYSKGDKITDAAVIAAMLDHHVNHHCRKVLPQ